MEEIERKIEKKSNSLPHTDGHSASVNTISSSSVVMTKNQIHYHTQMDTVPVLIPSQAAVL